MLREATRRDFDFIFSQIIEGAEHGHYDRKIANDSKAANDMNRELMSIIDKQQRIGGMSAKALVYEIEKCPVGFVVVSSVAAKNGIELLMAGIEARHRRKGHATAMIRQVVDEYRGHNVVLLARCAPESEFMFNILKKIGFGHKNTGTNGFRGLGYLV
ncbi:GNAT family N-acetyltransferase [Pseudodesulfovibrio senegalensis]|uniref:GNAT family N-acetyltransferase n=1 Tax=Pseudodesulfovibrio senegalensis TaxID=1721087 RepID=A0A6N6N786_9BACT|nr:GNAT family N-acetyltransferase [Pseudodesulfovibrio senegalensis]KAB1443581.1 GNAT family N-acetyltransferase [Pseudodesulfovibrio senegalensis]